MSSSTSSSSKDDAAETTPAASPAASGGSKASARLFLASMAGGLVLAVAAASLADESFIHTGPEYGMSEAYQDHIASLCKAKAAPELLLIGDSRAVAGLSIRAIREAGIPSEKFALGGAGLFAGWATLDQLLACGVRPNTCCSPMAP